MRRKVLFQNLSLVPWNASHLWWKSQSFCSMARQEGCGECSFGKQKIKTQARMHTQTDTQQAYCREVSHFFFLNVFRKVIGRRAIHQSQQRHLYCRRECARSNFQLSFTTVDFSTRNHQTLHHPNTKITDCLRCCEGPAGSPSLSFVIWSDGAVMLSLPCSEANRMTCTGTCAARTPTAKC